MKLSKQYLLFLLLINITFFISCNKDLSTDNQLINNCQKRYNAELFSKFLDSIEDNLENSIPFFTIHLQEYLNEKRDSKVLIIANIVDIVKYKDSTYLMCSVSQKPSFKLRLKCNDWQLKKARNTRLKEESTNYIIICDLKKIIKAYYQIYTTVLDCEDDSTVELYVGHSDGSFIVGNCIDIQYLGYYDKESY